MDSVASLAQGVGMSASGIPGAGDALPGVAGTGGSGGIPPQATGKPTSIRFEEIFGIFASNSDEMALELGGQGSKRTRSAPAKQAEGSSANGKGRGRVEGTPVQRKKYPRSGSAPPHSGHVGGREVRRGQDNPTLIP